jgi:hypothetical protein
LFDFFLLDLTSTAFSDLQRLINIIEDKAKEEEKKTPTFIFLILNDIQ